MAEADVDTVRRAFDAFIDNDFEAFFAIASTEIAVHPRREEPGVKDRYVGWDEMLEYLTNWYSGWEDYTAEAERYIDAGEYVIVDVREVGVAERSGLRVEDNFAHALKVEDGKVVEWRMYGPVEEAFDALGLEREPAE